MANEHNLIPQNRRTKNEQREIAKKGGIKSGQVRAERKKLREELEYLLNQGECQEKICLALIEKALNGNTKAFEIIRDTIGEKNPINIGFRNAPIIIDDINPFSELTTEELRQFLIEDEK